MIVSLTFDLDIPDRELVLILKLVIEGLSNEQIADRLGITVQQLDLRLGVLKLDKGIDLVEATRGRLVTWQFP